MIAMVKVKFVGNVPYQRTIADMEIGQVAYTVPWAYCPQTGDLDESFPITDKRQGTSELRIARVPDSFVVELVADSDYAWNKGNER